MNINSWIKDQLGGCCTKWFKGTWNHCCCKHDKCYDDAVNKPSQSMCDTELYECVKASCKYCGWIALSMWTAVRIKGHDYFVAARVSSTVHRGATGITAMGIMSVNQTDIISAVETISVFTGWGSTIHTVALVVTGLLTWFGIIGGKVDGESKPPMKMRGKNAT